MKRKFFILKNLKKVSPVFGILTVFCFFSCSAWFQDKVSMQTDGKFVSLGELFKTETKIESLDSPAQVFASQGLYPDSIKLSWTEVENATSYRIERAVVKTVDPSGNWNVPDESEFNSLEIYNVNNSYTDVILKEQIEEDEYFYHYFYKIYAENKEKGLISEGSDNVLSQTRAEGWLFAPPLNLNASKGKSTSKIKLSWDSVSGASRYKIYRGENENNVSLIKTVYGNLTSFDDSIPSKDQGTEFYYKVTAVNSLGIESAFSKSNMGYSLVEGAPAVSEKVEVADGFGTSLSELKIKWKEVEKTSETAVIRYNLYRTSSKDSVYKKIGSNLTATSYTDKSVSPGLIYYYFVQTVCLDEGLEIKSAFTENSNENFGFLLSSPAELEVGDGSSSEKVILVWSKAIGSQHKNFTYKIYVSSTQEDLYSELMSGIEGIENENGYLEYEIDKYPYFKISTVNSEGLESSQSFAAAPMPAAPQNVTASKTSFMNSDLAPNSNNIYPVKITWEKPSQDEPAGYYVYRSAKTDSGFRKLNENPVTETEFIDDSSESLTKVGVPYFYKVVSINSLGQGKKSNNPQVEYDDAVLEGGDAFKNIKCLGYGALTREQWFREYNKTCMSSQKKLTLMHKPNDTDKLGSESVEGTISGTLKYTAKIAGLGAEIKMPYTNYADFWINDNEQLGVYFCFESGSTDTTSNMSGNGKMSGTVKCSGMYPGEAYYGNLEIKSGAAGGGTYGVKTFDLEGNEILSSGAVDWLVGEEGR